MRIVDVGQIVRDAVRRGGDLVAGVSDRYLEDGRGAERRHY